VPAVRGDLRLPEYYLTRIETAILRGNIAKSRNS